MGDYVRIVFTIVHAVREVCYEGCKNSRPLRDICDRHVVGLSIIGEERIRRIDNENIEVRRKDDEDVGPMRNGHSLRSFVLRRWGRRRIGRLRESATLSRMLATVVEIGRFVYEC